MDNEEKDAFDQSKGPQLRRASTENALESETEDDVVHIDAPAVRRSKIGGSGYDPPTETLGPEGGNTENQGGWIEESGYGVPILASDEVAKELGMEYLQPAVSPPQERRGSTFYPGVDAEAPLSYQSGFRRSSRPGSVTNSRPTSRPTSRPSSRPGSIHGSLPALSRFTSHEEREDMFTPLADVEEYEPLFPQDEDKESHRNPAIERLKKMEMMKRRFPSQDIWEDTPNSLQLQATVTSPEPTEEAVFQAPKAPAGGFEPPEAESARKGEATEDERAKMVPREERLAKSHFKPHVQEEIHRPGLNKRFPSRDIWEDSPDSARLETTVDSPLDEDFKSPVDEGLQAGAVVKTSGRPKEADIDANLEREGATAGASIVEKPTIPPRPTKNKTTGNTAAGAGAQAPIQIPPRPPKKLHQVPPAEALPPPTKSAEASPTDGRKGPLLPDRPKPQVPVRPNKPVARDSSESIPLSKTISTSSAGSAAAAEESRDTTSSPSAPKHKPTVPARPVAGKIAALKAGFMSDLNKQLQLGPQGPKLPEKPAEEKDAEEEKAPLADARKGRARGPARRKPGTSSTGTSEATEEKFDVSRWGIQDAWTVWQSNGGSINVVSSEPATAEPPPVDPLERPEAPTPIKALTAHNEEIADVPGIQALKEAVPSSETGPLANEAGAEPEASGIKEEAVSNLLQHDTRASRTTLKELSELTSKAPAATAPDETPSAAGQPDEVEVVEDLGSENAEKLTAYLGAEGQEPETTSDVGNVTVLK